MPTGWRSEYLESKSQQKESMAGQLQGEPAGDLEGGAEDLGSHEFRHFEGSQTTRCKREEVFFGREPAKVNDG